MVRRALILVAALVGLNHAQETPSFRSGIDIVTVTVTVTDREGRFVPGLRQDDFTIFEDGQRKDVTSFADESAPVSLGLLLDASGSMTGGRLDLARASISRLVSRDLDASAEWFLARFTSTVVVAQEWTSDRAAIVQPLRETRATGDTGLYDAIALTIPLVEEGHLQKKALLLVSDGGESKSLVSLDEVRMAIGLHDVRVYSVGVDAPAASGGEKLKMTAMRDVADDTGGRTWVVSSGADIASATAQLADELRHMYLVSYATTRAKDGRRHSIRVDVRGRGLKVRARRGF